MKKIGMGRKWYNKKLETIKLIATINLLPQNIKFSYHHHLVNGVKGAWTLWVGLLKYLETFRGKCKKILFQVNLLKVNFHGWSQGYFNLLKTDLIN